MPAVNPAKALYRAVRSWWEKTTIRQIIAEYDTDVSVNMFSGARFFPSMIESINPLAPASFDEFGTHVSRIITKDIGETAANVIQGLKPDILQYLGPDVRLDDLMLFWFNPESAKSRSISGSWHDDNVGHRLKIYICLKGDRSTPTVVIPNSHRHIYRYRLSELARFAGFKNTKPKIGEQHLRYRTGDVAMFDTHCLHRGLYEEPAGERVVIVAEFCNRYKSNKISGKAPCGPGSSPTGRVVFGRAAFSALNATGLIDPLLVQDSGDTLTYSIANNRRG